MKGKEEKDRENAGANGGDKGLTDRDGERKETLLRLKLNSGYTPV